jgi:hypothetical protein
MFAFGIITTIVMGAAFSSRATIVGPYTNDFYTLHLWHFDETGATPANAPTNALAFDSSVNPQTIPIVLSNTPGEVNVSGWPGYPPTQFALQAQPAYSYPGVANFGYCVETTNFSCLYAPWSDPDPTLSDVTTYLEGTNMSDYINTNSGAFTFEALVNPLALPGADSQEIICGDSGFSYRAWQFRLKNVTGAGFPYGQIELNMNINAPAGVIHDVFASIPSTGPDAFVPANAGTANGWYHVAVTFTGGTPTNGDTPDQVRFYWTPMDPTRTNDDLVLLTNVTYGFTNIATPIVTLGGNGRGDPIINVGDGDDFIGYIDEARVSAVCRSSNYLASPYGMEFNSTVFNASPNIGGPPTNTLVGYDQTLTLATSVIGSVPVALQWYQNGVLLAGQTNANLVISNVTFAANGNYQLTATNAEGGTNSVIGVVTVGAAFNGLFNSGVNSNGVALYQTAPGSVDPHWQLTQSADSANPGPNAIVMSGPPNAGVGETPSSCWIGTSSGGGSSGTYSYQEQFQIDNTVIDSNAMLSGYCAMVGPSGGNNVQMYLNGVETNVTIAGSAFETKQFFNLTAGLQPGSNTLVVNFVSNGGVPQGWFYINLAGIGLAYPAGLPVITNEPPASQTVTAGAVATIPEVTLGCPPLSYQWLSNSVPIAGATNENLSFVATNFSTSEIVGGQFTADYQVVASSGSTVGSVTSSVDALTIQIPPLTANSAGVPIWDSASSDTNIYVLFSAAVDPITSTETGNYSVSGSGSPSVVSAALGSAPNEVILTTSPALTPGDTYTLTVKNVKNTYLTVLSPTPTNLTVGVYPATTALWVKANTGITTDANGVNTWNDLSGNGNTLSDSDGAPYEPQLIPNALNGQPVIGFNATNETFLSASSSQSLAITGDMSIFAVVNFATLAGGTNGEIVAKTDNNNEPAPYDYYAQSGNVHLLRGNGTANASVNSTAGPSLGFTHIVDVVMQGTSVTHRLDGQPNGTGTLSTTIVDQGQDLFIGTRQDAINRLTGNLAELIIVGSALSTNDVASLENYLAGEYSLPVGANSYPVITQEPVASTNASQGGTLIVPAAASGSPAVAYQWYDTNNIAQAGQTSATLDISDIQTADSYYLAATNVFGAVTSSVVAVTLTSGLNVSLGPPNVTLYGGQSVTLTAVASGTIPFYYQWYQGASLILHATNASYTATATPTLTDYYCTVTNAYLGLSTTNAGPVALVGITAPTNTYQATVLNDHPVAFWRLTEGPDNGSGDGGTVANDYVGGHNGTYTNVVLGLLPGFSPLVNTDSAAEFSVYNDVLNGNWNLLANSNNSYAGEIDQSASGLPNVNFALPAGSNAELSVEAWVWAFENVITNRAQVAGAGIVAKGYGNGGEQFDLDDNSDFRFLVRDAVTGSAHVMNGSINPTTNTWYQVVGVWDGANGAGHLYVNGVDNIDNVCNSPGLGLQTATTTNTAFTQATLVSIGSRAQSESTTNFDLPFRGRIQDVSLYNYALSPVQVFTHYQAGIYGITFSTTSTNIEASVTTTNLTLSWPRNWIGWQLQAQTNKVTAGIGSNWVNDTSVSATTTNLVTMPIVKTNGTVFYRLLYNP